MRRLISSGLDTLSEVPGLHSGGLGGGHPWETGQTPGTELEFINSEGRVQSLEGREARKQNGNTKDAPSTRVQAFFSGCHRKRGQKRCRNYKDTEIPD